jgi:pimeloyl-ACP methyl ester carboxylesterase
MTPRPLSQLIYKRIQDNGASPRIITLHDHNQHGQDVKVYALAAAPHARIIGLESYKGVFVGKEIVGYTWFVGPQDRPSPLFFGDALAEIERFLWDEIDRQGTSQDTTPNRTAPELPVLLGVGQGAIMAIAAAAAVPDLLSGVIAVDGSLPIVPGWQPPLAPLDGLPIQLIERTAPAPTDGVLNGDHLATTLRAWGGDVTRLTAAPGEIPHHAMSTWLTDRAPRRAQFVFSR